MPHPLLHPPLTGTQLPALVLHGRAAGERIQRAHPVPALAARWTLLVLDPREDSRVDEHRTILAAEAVTALVVARSPAGGGTVLVDPQGVIQHVGADLDEALDAVRAFRTGERLPVAAGSARPLQRCSNQGRRRRAAIVARRRV